MKECNLCASCYEDSVERCPGDGTLLDATLPGSPLLDQTYRLERRLGEGGMGIVYRARHEGVKRSVAVKLIRPDRDWDPASLARFRLEAEALGKLQHPHIVNITDSGVDPREKGIPYLVTEFLDGVSLQAHSARLGALPLPDALPLLEAIAQAIDFAHERGVLHRDLKPQNVFLAGKPASVKLLDFGLALLRRDPADLAAPPAPTAWIASRPGREKSEHSTLDLDTLISPGSDLEGDRRDGREAPAQWGDGLTGSAQLAGTPLYMAPERFTGGVATPACDVYALGILAYRLLTGREPFLGSLSAIARGHVHEAPPLPSSQHPALAPDVDDALLPALAKDPARRPPRALDVVTRLRSADLAARQRAWRAREWPRRAGLAAALSVLALVLAAVLPQLRSVSELEGRAIDARYRGATPRAPDPRLLMVVFDEESLAADPTPLPQLADEAARRLEAVFDAGARAIAIDMLLPAAWSRSPAFSRLVLQRADALVLAGLATPSGAWIGPEAIQGLTSAALEPGRAVELFGLVNVDEDADGVVRRARLRYPRTAGPEQDSWAARAARLVAPAPPQGGVPAGPASFWIDYTTDVSRVPRVSWMQLPGMVELEPSAFAGKLVLVGMEIAASGDMHRVPSRSGPPEPQHGLVLQAVVTDTILAGFPVREASRGATAAFLVAAYLLSFFSLLASSRPLAACAAVGAVLLLGLAGSYALFHSRRLLVEIAGPLVSFALCALLALALRGRLSPYPVAEA